MTGLTGEKYAVPLAFASAEELARSEEVDLVVLTVKVPHHLELIRPALEAGKMVTLDRPSNQFGSFGSAEIAAIGQELHVKLADRSTTPGSRHVSA
ncbi:hypothetical protein N4G69_45350 [Streptomyces mirabilis]|uniref:Gfo/Idh/MocA family oxidoreductase n=1 Tax=Streptomyces mirabilis TaxID=68239 RepID=UPI0021C1CCC9|nr:Gfo/Idh/MocA family oxidoreductase [Streptomyces mirabilis]MCT9112709.1 hypothetical protein [Streptomyces mirabilis]